MENRSSEFPIKPILLGLLLLLAWKVTDSVTTMVTAFFSTLITIAIIAASLLAAYLVFSFIRDRELGQNKKTRKVNKYQRELKQTLANTPRHLHQEIKSHFEELQRQVFIDKPTTRVDNVLDRTKQVVSIFRRKEK